MKLLRVALCYDARLLDEPRRLRSADLLLFPELFIGGYRGLRTGKTGTTDPRLLDRLRNVSRTIPSYLIAGSLPLREGHHRWNRSLVFHRGRILYRYDKVHLFRGTGDHRLFRAGDRTGTFRLRARGLTLRVGIAICYDLRFPELVRAMAARGMDILAVPARWPRARGDAWFSLLKARAIENQIFVLGCNARGVEGGDSYVFDPVGRLLYHGREKRRPGIVRLTLDTRALASARRDMNTVREARLLTTRGRM